MVENRPIRKGITHITLIIGVFIIVFPIYIAFVASTHHADDLIANVHVWFGDELINNYDTVWNQGRVARGGVAVSVMMMNSLIMALGISIGKIAISIISAFALVYFRFPFRTFFFWIIFVTLMLPVEVRIIPTYAVVADLNLLNTYTGLILPLIASATATFLFRQFFLSIPEELAESARMDGAGPIRFFIDILLPLARTSIAALFVILFTFGWNQYLWPLIMTTDPSMTTIVMGIKNTIEVADSVPEWNITMTIALLAMVPPLIVIIVMQKQFVKGLVTTEK